MQRYEIISCKQALELYLSSLILEPTTIHWSPKIIEATYKHFEMSSEEFYEFLRAYCQENNINLEEVE